MALSLTMLATGVSAFARCKGHAMSFEVPGRCTATDSMCMMDRDDGEDSEEMIAAVLLTEAIREEICWRSARVLFGIRC